MASGSSKILGALRQLACLGLPGRAVVPEVVELLNRLAGFDIWGVRFVDQNLRLVDGFASPDLPPSLLLDFAANFHGNEGGERTQGINLSQILRSGQRVLVGSRFVDLREIRNTPLWERIIEPTGMSLPTHMPLTDGGSPLGVVVLSREIGVADFSPATIRLLEQAQPWLCHAFANQANDSGKLDGSTHASGDGAMLVLDASGKIESASSGAIGLLLNATGDGIGLDSLRNALAGKTGALLRRLAQSVGAGLNGGDASVPAYTFTNPYGIFHLRAYALVSAERGGTAKVALHIERRVPTVQRLFASPAFLGLTNREREVALSLVRGRSYGETAADMGVKPSSVVYYVRSLFQRLDIDSRDELLPALVAEQEIS